MLTLHLAFEKSNINIVKITNKELPILQYYYHDILILVLQKIGCLCLLKKLQTFVMMLKWIASPVWISRSAAETKTSWMMFMAVSTGIGFLSTPCMFFNPTWTVHKPVISSDYDASLIFKKKIYISSLFHTFLIIAAKTI